MLIAAGATLLSSTPSKDERLQVPTVSVIMPFYNAGSAIFRMKDAVAMIRKAFPNLELVLVDDGSTDGTFSVVKSLADEKVKVVGYEANRGKGQALLHGFKFATSDIVIFADGDLQVLPLNLQDYFASLKTHDIAIGSKRVVGAELACGFKRRFLSIGFNALVRILLSLPVSDTQAGFKAFRRSALERILPFISVKKYAFDVEILTVAKLLRMKVAQLPVRVTLESKFRIRNMLRMFVDVLGIAYRLRLKAWYQKNLRNPRHKYEPLLRW